MISNTTSNLEIRNVRLADSDAGTPYTVYCNAKKVLEIKPYDECSRQFDDKVSVTESVVVVDGRGGLLLPSLCHSHIHLDKCFILDKGAPLVIGDFSEALKVTCAVKQSFKHQQDDLYARGDRLIRESLEAGVTVMRAHVEVDRVVGKTCLEAGIKLKNDWRGVCDVQLAVFMQDPLYHDEDSDSLPGENTAIVLDVLKDANYAKYISVVGSAPYVESTRERQRANIGFVLDCAMQADLHVDFHLDYDLSPLPTDLEPKPKPESDNDNDNDNYSEPEPEPLIYHLLDVLHKRQWTKHMPSRIITIGHATRLTLFSPSQLSSLHERERILLGASSLPLPLPIYFVGLPQSDLYMMGRDRFSGSPVRGTLDVCKLGRDFGLNVVMSVNNVGNAFTPQGTPDPLGLCPLGVAVYQDGTLDGCRRLLKAVSTGSKTAIGLPEPPNDSLVPSTGSRADFVILHNNQSVQSAVLNPSYERTTIKDGRVVALRKRSMWSCR